MASCFSNISQSTILSDMTASLMQSCTSPRSSQLAPLLYGFPEVMDPIFTGRTDSSNSLLQLFEKRNNILVSGMGGIGKTSFAIYCATEWIRANHFSYSAFLNMTTDNTAQESFKGLAKKIGFSVEKISDNRIKEIYDQMVLEIESKKILLIFDNMENVKINKYLPNSSRKNIFILGTSKHIEFTRLFSCIYNLKCLSDESSIQLVLNVLSDTRKKFKNEITDIWKLAKYLSFLPLSIRQAAALIKVEVLYGDSNFSIEDYIKIYKKQFSKYSSIERTTNYDKTLYTVLKLNISKAITNEYTEKILNCMAFMNTTHIYARMFLSYGDFTEQQYYEAEKQLKKYSIITIENSLFDRHIQIHRTFLDILLSDMNQSKRNDVLPLVFKIILNSTDINLHHEFLLPYMNAHTILQGYKQVFSCSAFRHRLGRDLQRVNCSLSDIQDWSVWHYAFYNRDFLIIRKLLNDKINLDALKSKVLDWTILHATLLSGKDLEELNFIPKNMRAVFKTFFSRIINSRLSCGIAAIHICIANECDENFEELMDLGIDVNIADNNGNNVLHFAIKYDFDATEKLMLSGANINFRNNDGNTLIHIAATKGNRYVVEALLASGANINLRNNLGYSPVHLAALTKHVPLAELMIESHSNYNICEDELLSNSDLSYSMLLKNGENKQVYTFSTMQIWVIITTRQKSRNIYKCILLRKLTKFEDGVTMLEHCIEESYEILLSLVQIFYNIPLAMRIAAAYILNEGIQVKDFLNFIRDSPTPIKHRKFMESCSDKICSSSSKLMCFVISTMKEKYPRAFDVLSYASFMDPEDICPNRLSEYLNINLDQVQEEIQRLINYSLLEKIINESYIKYEMHKFLGSVVHIFLVQTRHEICKRVLSVEFMKYFYPKVDYVLDFMEPEDICAVYKEVYEYTNQGKLILDRLRKAGCTLHNTHEWSALHYAAGDDILAARHVISRLIARGTDVNISVNAVTPLHIAAASGNDWAVIRLLLAKANVNMKTNGRTALHLAAVPSYDTRDTIRALIKGRANKYAADNSNNTAAQIAIQCGNSHLIGLLTDM